MFHGACVTPSEPFALLSKANLAKQEGRLAVANAELGKAQALLDEKQAELDKVQAKFDAAMNEKMVRLEERWTGALWAAALRLNEMQLKDLYLETRACLT